MAADAVGDGEAAAHEASGRDPLAALRTVQIGDGQIALTWLGQAGFALRVADLTLLLDPFLSEHPDRAVPPAFSPDEGSGIDAVLCTHDHLDHFDADAVARIARASPEALIVVPRPIVSRVADLGIAVERIIGAQPDETVDVRGVSVIPVPARHGVDVADAYTFGQELSNGLYRYLGYVIDAGGVRVYHGGDTILYDGMEGLLRRRDVDIAMLPINGRTAERESQNLVGNLDHAEAARLAAAIGADTVIPMHYDMFPGNLGYPGKLVDVVVRDRLDITVLVPALKRVLIYSAPPRRRDHHVDRGNRWGGR